MEPTLRNGERILVFKLPHVLSELSLFRGMEPFHPNDIIVFQSPDTPDRRYVKRVVAKGPRPSSSNVVDAKPREDLDSGGNVVRVEYARGDLFVDRHRVDEPFINPAENERRDSYREIGLEPGMYYVLGDNRDNSKDSRMFGALDGNRIVGRAVLRFWPLSRFGLLR
jgi:signal peptidase I